MAVAFVRNHTAGASTASGTTVAATVLTADVAIGSTLAAWVSFDNSSATTPTVSSISKPAGETNVWVKVAEHDASAVSSDVAVRGERWVIRTTVAWPVSTTVTATLSAAKPYKTILLEEFSGVTITVRGASGTGTSTGGTPFAATSGTALVAGDLVLGAGSFEIGVIPTGDADTLNGSWSAAYTVSTTPGSSNTNNVTAIAQYKVVTATGVQTYHPTGLSDSGAAVVALVPFTNTAPNAPTLTSPVGGQVIDRANTLRLDWDFSDPDAGDSQSKYDARYKLVSSGTWIDVTGTTPNTFHDITGGTLTAGDSEWQARTYDALGLVGTYSASSFFTAANAPAAPTITAPLNGGTVSTDPASVTWSAPSQTSYQVRKVADLAGVPDTATVYYDSGEVVSVPVRTVSLAFPINSRYEHLQVRIKSAGLWSTWASIRVLVSYTPPNVPTFALTVADATGSVLITITNPAGGTVVSYNDIKVNDGSGLTRRATAVAVNGSWTYWTPVSGRDYATPNVQVVAVGDNGTTSTSA